MWEAYLMDIEKTTISFLRNHVILCGSLSRALLPSLSFIKTMFLDPSSLGCTQARLASTFSVMPDR